MLDGSSACSGVTEYNASRGVFRKGPPEAVRISFVTWRAVARPQALMGAIMLGIHRDQFGSMLLDGFHHQLAAGNQHLFIGQSDPFAAPYRFVGRRETGHADNRRHHGIYSDRQPKSGPRLRDHKAIRASRVAPIRNPPTVSIDGPRPRMSRERPLSDETPESGRKEPRCSALRQGHTPDIGGGCA